MIREKVKTGVKGLDDMLDGGLLSSRPYVVSGAPGTGKTTLALQFLAEGARNGEQVLYVALDEPPNEVAMNAKRFSWSIDSVRVLDATPDIMSYDKTPVRDVSSERKVEFFRSVPEEIRKTSDKGPTDMSVNTLQELLKQEFATRKYSRVVVDSLTSLRYFYIKTSEEYTTIQSFMRIFSDIGVTTIMTMHVPEVYRPDVESQFSRGEIRLHKWFDGRGLMRGVNIEKYRGSSHDETMRRFKIASDGIVVAEVPSKKKSSKTKPSTGDSGVVEPAEEAVWVGKPAVPTSARAQTLPAEPQGAPPVQTEEEEPPPPPDMDLGGGAP
ncbi:MAG: AAA family ATPase [Thermoplasmata archaeon]|nr:AAA family ATPase [Thermoplasmata archaeon]